MYVHNYQVNVILAHEPFSFQLAGMHMLTHLDMQALDRIQVRPFSRAWARLDRTLAHEGQNDLFSDQITLGTVANPRVVVRHQVVSCSNFSPNDKSLTQSFQMQR